MSILKLLFVEDNVDEIKTFEDTLKRYLSVHKEKQVSVTKKSTLADSLKVLNNTFDGAIVDLKLNRDGDAGNKLINEIIKKYRIPVAIYTGNPQNVDIDLKDHFEIFIRGAVKYDAPLDFLFSIYETGLTRIFGGRGTIEKAMNDTFWNSIIPSLKDWQIHNHKGMETEKALLRFTVNHIVEILDSDSEIYFPEEMYITPPNTTSVKTGHIVKRKNQDQYYVVLSPACDLVKHNGQIKTERILVCTIEDLKIDLIEKARKDMELKILKKDSKEIKLNKKAKLDKAQRILSQIPRNSYSSFYHYLPKTKAFQGGIINFRKLEAFKPKDYKNTFENALTQISMAFTKDIVARFSSYYARQGQPDFDFESLTKSLSE